MTIGGKVIVTGINANILNGGDTCSYISLKIRTKIMRTLAIAIHDSLVPDAHGC